MVEVKFTDGGMPIITREILSEILSEIQSLHTSEKFMKDQPYLYDLIVTSSISLYKSVISKIEDSHCRDTEIITLILSQVATVHYLLSRADQIARREG